MGDDDRAVLAAPCGQPGTVPVIDETIAEVDLEGGPMPLPFAAHDPRTVTVGSSSKSHWGGLRTGWVRAPRALLPAWSTPGSRPTSGRRCSSSWCCSS